MAKFNVHVCDPLPQKHVFLLSGDQQVTGNDRLLLSTTAESESKPVGLSGDERYVYD